ncbi:hypothetical protein KAU51_04100 [Candidatus Parcubacteria bacterium]|nr:hypothetical protein [Candidatus Parcubacteria bacterium]
MNILDQTLKEQRQKKKDKKTLSKCWKCGSKDIVDNTFMNGSRLAGQIKCNKCGALSMF